MIRISADEFSRAGDQYLGRSYEEMDCQAFVERCMRDCGLQMDLAGSNAWIREVMAHGWVGSPEECRRVFGVIPAGALLFILKQDGKEPAKYRGDGIGNASHIGIKTGRGDGAIHSSSSRGCVATSVFKDKTINGGWNMVGLYDKIDYGQSINWMLEHIGIGQDPGQDPAEGGKAMRGKVVAENGGTVKLRAKPSSNCGTYWDIPVGTEMDVLERGDEWSRCAAGSRIGWMKNEFIQLDGDEVPPEDFGPGDLDGDDQITITLQLSRDQAEALLNAADRIAWQLTQVLGARG